MELFSLCDAERASSVTVVALGFFDGLHIGHAALLEKTVAEAAVRGATPCVFTFRDFPTLKGGQRLYTEEERLSRFGEYGIARVVLADFPLLSSLSPEQFVSEILLGKLRAAAVVCGFNYRFGKGAAGDAALLSALLATHGVPLFTVEEQRACGKSVSSTAIKAALAAGNADTATAMLGRPHTLTGCVLHGKALGRKIGVPTANIPFPDGVFVPMRGVWAVVCDVEGVADGVRGVANIGVRPTVDTDGVPNCEVHFFDEMPTLYGKRVRVHFLAFIRPEMTFDSLDALVSRITLDKQIAKEYLDRWNGQS